MSDTPHRWFHDLAWFWGAAFLANFVPHFVQGISGAPMQSPFADPPGIGLSSSMVNVGWGLFNLALAYLLLVRVGRLDLRRWRHLLPVAAGFIGFSFFVAHHFAPLHGGNLNG